MDHVTSAYLERGNCNSSLKATLLKLNQAYANNQLDGYSVLRLKGGIAEKTPCNLQWGPMMRV
jgi:hypothetical protein